MRVSITIPVYNAEDYLDACIESALNQTHADMEIVEVDDGSTDASVRYLTAMQIGYASATNPMAGRHRP